MNSSIKIFANQLIYDIQTETRKSGFFQINPDNPEALNEAQLGSEASDTDYIIRRCQQGVDSLLDVFHKFLTSVKVKVGSSNEADVSTITDDKVLSNIKYWVINLTFDGRRNVYSDGLASICHRYIEYHALYNWALMTMPNLSEGYFEQMNSCEHEIKKIVYHKEPPTRPTY